MRTWLLCVALIVAWLNVLQAAPTFRAALFAVPEAPPGRWHLACLVGNQQDQEMTVTLALSTPARAFPHKLRLQIAPYEIALGTFRLELPVEASEAVPVEIEASGGETRVQLSLRLQATLNLAGEWQECFTGASPKFEYAGVTVPEQAFHKVALPAQVQQLGFYWFRRKVQVPASWRGRALHLYLRQVDDNDVTFFNGRKIGATQGWDVVRDCKIPAELVNYGGENVIAIQVENTFAGGGIFRLPLYLAPEGVTLPEQTYAFGPLECPAPPGRIGAPAPLRPLHTAGGALRYPDESEVCLWGTNYYPMAWDQYVNMKAQGADFHQAIRRDLDEMQQMGIEVLRLHLFDREMSNSKGDLIDNQHLELLDYLISELDRRGLYFVMTSMAWWWSKSQLPDAFSTLFPKQGLLFVPRAIAAEHNYLGQLLQHVNRYTGRKYCQEPCIAAYTLLNEPTYYTYGELADTSNTEPALQVLRGAFEAWRRKYNFPDSAESYNVFMAATVARWANGNLQVLRKAGATQPAGISAFAVHTIPTLAAGYGLSRAQLFTVSKYVGSAEAWKGHDCSKDNYMSWFAPDALPPELAGLAHLVYEFDAISTTRSYLYPGLAARWRAMGMQVATQFQYDSSVTAARNSDWNIHYLNFEYTPRKAVSFLIARDLFHTLPRGCAFIPGEEENVLPEGFAFSFKHDVSLEVTSSRYLQSAPTEWRPLPAPKRPKFIMAVGNCPYWRTSGTGLVRYVRQPWGAELLITPNVEQLHPPSEYWHSGPARLLHPEQEVELVFLLPEWRDGVVKAPSGRIWQLKNGTVTLPPGRYELHPLGKNR